MATAVTSTGTATIGDGRAPIDVSDPVDGLA